mmetsp:Transcript_22532/g.64816  ORF Transcript_22532/g.64816 Transcript_22532/m.64816 type:complete len:231 (+) Transcript_22532:1765-2457(+)
MTLFALRPFTLVALLSASAISVSSSAPLLSTSMRSKASSIQKIGSDEMDSAIRSFSSAFKSASKSRMASDRPFILSCLNPSLEKLILMESTCLPHIGVSRRASTSTSRSSASSASATTRPAIVRAMLVLRRLALSLLAVTDDAFSSKVDSSFPVVVSLRMPSSAVRECRRFHSLPMDRIFDDDDDGFSSCFNVLPLPCTLSPPPLISSTDVMLTYPPRRESICNILSELL